MKIRQIAFTGSTATGRKIQEQAAKSNLKRVSLELGGKSPSLIFDDADMDTAVTKSMEGILANTGQICAMASRIFVQESIADKFINALSEGFKTVSSGEAIGDPSLKTTQVGPIADKIQFKRVMELIESGKKDGTLVSCTRRFFLAFPIDARLVPSIYADLLRVVGYWRRSARFK